jgi:hypothetical protein
MVQENAPAVVSQLSIHDFTNGTIVMTHKEAVQLNVNEFEIYKET